MTIGRNPYKWDVLQNIPEVRTPDTPISEVAPNASRATTGEIVVAFRCAPVDLQRFTSCILSGAEVLYRDDYDLAQRVVDGWMMATEYPQPYPITCPSYPTLEEIGDLISVAVGELAAALPPTPERTADAAPLSANERNGTSPIVDVSTEGLSDDDFYGICISIVNGITDAVVDFFEQLEALSNALELSAKLASSIPLPIIGDVADFMADAALLIDFLAEAGTENFLSADTTPRRLAWADDLFCRGNDEKQLSMPTIGESLAGLYLGELIDWNDPFGSLAEVASGMFTDEQVYYFCLGFALGGWVITGDFQGLITRTTWRYWVNTGKNNPQSPVPDCGEPELAEYVIGSARRIYVNGTPTTPEDLPDGYTTIDIPPGATVRIVSDTGYAPGALASGATNHNNTPHLRRSDYGTLPSITVVSTINVWYVQQGTTDEAFNYTNEGIAPYNVIGFPYNGLGAIEAEFTLGT